MESQLMTSPLNFFATWTATALFPTAVGPKIMTRLFGLNRNFNQNIQNKQCGQQKNRQELLSLDHFIFL